MWYWLTGRAALFLALALLFQIETLLISPQHDSAAWLFMGARQWHGQMPGRDLWDNKLPLIYLIGRGAIASGAPQLFLWVGEAVLTMLGSLAVSALVHRAANPQIGTLAGALLCVASGAPSYHAGGFMTETYAMPLSAIAVWLVYGPGMHGRMRDFTGGLAWTLAVAFRLPLVIAGLAVMGYTFMCRLRLAQSPQIPLPPAGALRQATQARGGWTVPGLGAVLVGASFGLLLVLAHPILAGYLPHCLEAAVLWPAELTGPHVPGPLSVSTAARLGDFTQDIAKLGWLHLAAMAGLVTGYRGVHSQLVMLTSIWYVGALGSAAFGWASYAHYHYVAFAPLCVGAGLLVRHLPPPRARPLSAGLIYLTVGIVGGQNVKLLARHVLRTRDADKAALVEYICARTDSDATILMWVRGRNNDLLYRVDRPPGIRHFLARSYFDMDLALFDEMVAEFLAHPPRWIVQEMHLSGPLLSGPVLSEWEGSIPTLQRLQEYVREHYRREARFGGYVVLKLLPVRGSVA